MGWALLFNHSILHVTAQMIALHSYILEQLVFTAPRERDHLSLAHRIDWPSFPGGRAMLHPPSPRLGVAPGLFINNLSTLAVSIKHTCKLSYNYLMKPMSFYTYLTFWAHDTLHTYIYQLWLLFLFCLPVTRQVSWPPPLMSGTTKNRWKYFIFWNIHFYRFMSRLCFF
jgi:hypothetical protein